jgi:adenylate kinase
MQVALTGTPGVGKTTVATALAARGSIPVHELQTATVAARYASGTDAERETVIADLSGLRGWAAGRSGVIVSHLAHRLEPDRAIVLRCHPEELEDRLTALGRSAASVAENCEAEALDLILSEAVAALGSDRVAEVDTTGRPPAAIADEVERLLIDTWTPSTGIVDFSEVL